MRHAPVGDTDALPTPDGFDRATSSSLKAREARMRGDDIEAALVAERARWVWDYWGWYDDDDYW